MARRPVPLFPFLTPLAYPEFMKRIAFLLAFAAVLPGSLPALTGDLPSGASLIQRCIESEGGTKAMEHAQTAVITGTVEVTGHNLSGPLQIFEQGNKSYTSIELPGIGKMEE